MTTYVVYQCSVCRRTKNSIKDDVRAGPNPCNITKGCDGKLAPISETTEIGFVKSVAGLTDWYPRGKVPVSTAPTVEVKKIPVLTSSLGQITVATALSEPVLLAKFTRLRTDVSNYQQYTYKLSQASTQIPPIVNGVAGKDITGKILRFDQDAINAGRVQVRVNGVISTETSLTPNIVKFLPTPDTSTVPAGTVDVIVYSVPEYIDTFITLRKNTVATSTVSVSAWGNVSTIEATSLALNVYTSEIISQLKAAKMTFVGFYKEDRTTLLLDTASGLLMASPPYENVDRYMNFIAPMTLLSQSSATEIVQSGEFGVFVDSTAVVELFPPMVIPGSSYLTTDKFTTSAAVQTDTTSTRLTGKKIIGPL